MERAPSCSSLLTYTTTRNDDSEPESHGETTSLLSCPSNLGAMTMTQGDMSSQFVSQESLDDTTEPLSKSLLVSRNVVYSVPDRRSVSLNLPSNQVSSTGSQRAGASGQQGSLVPPCFLSKNTRATVSGPQPSSVQCSQTESIKPSQDTISTLQDNLHRASNDTNVDPLGPNANFSNPAANNHTSRANINEQQCPPSPLNNVRYRHLARTPSQTSQCSIGTVTANSSGSNSPASSELWETPHSSPLLGAHRGHASSKMCSQPTQCTEASLNEHRATSEDWQTHSMRSYIQGTSYIASGSDEHHDQQSSSVSGRLITIISNYTISVHSSYNCRIMHAFLYKCKTLARL